MKVTKLQEAEEIKNNKNMYKPEGGVTTVVNPVYKDAVDADKKAQAEAEKVKNEITKKANGITPDNNGEGKPLQKNAYTKKYELDESLFEDNDGKFKFHVYNISWDVKTEDVEDEFDEDNFANRADFIKACKDRVDEILEDLPEVVDVEIDNDVVDVEDGISDALFDEYGWSVNSFNYDEIVDEGLNEMTDKELDQSRRDLKNYAVEPVTPGMRMKLSPEGQQKAKELSCISMINSILAYGERGLSAEEVLERQERGYHNYLADHVKELGRDRVIELIQGQIDDIEDIDSNTFQDSEGISYNSIRWKNKENDGMDENYSENELLRILRSYKRLIDRDQGKHPAVVLDDISKSIDYVLNKSLTEAKDKKIEDLDDTLYTLVYDCLFPGNRFKRPNIANDIKVSIENNGKKMTLNQYPVDRYATTDDLNDIAVRVDNEEQAEKAKAVAQFLNLPFDYKPGKSENIFIIHLGENAEKNAPEYMKSIGKDIKDVRGAASAKKKKSEGLNEGAVDWVEKYNGCDIYTDGNKFFTNKSAKTLSDKTVDGLKKKIDDQDKAERKALDDMDEGKVCKKCGKSPCVCNKKTMNEDAKIFIELGDYEPWSGAVSTFEKIKDEGKLDELDSFLEMTYPEGLTSTELNDLLWFESEWIFDMLGISEEENEED